jgi:transposase-like protein
MANRESRLRWKELLLALRARSPHGVERGVADDHAGLRAAIREGLAEAAVQRCYVTSSRMRSLTCRARRTTIAVRSCAGCPTATVVAKTSLIRA